MTSSEPNSKSISPEEAYRRQVVQAYNQLTFTGFEVAGLHVEDVSLDNLFVHLSVEENIHGNNGGGREGQTEKDPIASREPRRPITSPHVEQQHINKLAQALQTNLLIKGEPGAGKTTLLRWLAVTFAQQRQREAERLGPNADDDRLPILVDLGPLFSEKAELNGRKMFNWLNILRDYVWKEQYEDIPFQLLEQLLKKERRCLLLFDGLDEIADRETRIRVVESLAALERNYRGNRIIIGSRTAGVSESETKLPPGHFKVYQIEHFSPDDVQRFFKFWYSQDPQLTAEQQEAEAENLYREVNRFSTRRQLAANPLLSTILLLIWRQKHTLPDRRVELYEDCCKILINRWKGAYITDSDDTRRTQEWEERHLRALALIAYNIHSHSSKSDEQPALLNKLIDKLVEYLQAENLCADQTTARRKARSYLEELAEHSGLLHHSQGSFSFPHPTFQEYLAARYIAAQDNYIDLVMEHLHDDWWREVHLMTIGHLGSGTPEGDKNKASQLILHILNVYKPPNHRLLQLDHNRWVQRIGLDKHILDLQFERNIAWMLGRELELAASAYLECVPESITAEAEAALSTKVVSLMREIIYDPTRHDQLDLLLEVAERLPQDQARTEVVDVLLQAIRDGDRTYAKDGLRLAKRIAPWLL